MTYLWLGIVILLSLVEVMTIKLTTIWYVVSALVSLLISIKSSDFLLQFGIFTILGTVLLITTKPFVQKFLGGIYINPKIDQLIGMDGIVTANITKKSLGEVKIGGRILPATANKNIKIGVSVKIVEVSNDILKVEEI